MATSPDSEINRDYVANSLKAEGRKTKISAAVCRAQGRGGANKSPGEDPGLCRRYETVALPPKFVIETEGDHLQVAIVAAELISGRNG